MSRVFLRHSFSTCTLYFQPKIELPEYGSDDDCSPKQDVNTLPSGFLSLDGGMEVLPSYPPSYQGNCVLLRINKHLLRLLGSRHGCPRLMTSETRNHMANVPAMAK